MISRGIDARDDLVQEFYGINTVTSKVDNVAITSGTISPWTERGYVLRPTGSEDVRADIARYFGLTELIGVYPRTPNARQISWRCSSSIQGPPRTVEMSWILRTRGVMRPSIACARLIPFFGG